MVKTAPFNISFHCISQQIYNIQVGQILFFFNPMSPSSALLFITPLNTLENVIYLYDNKTNCRSI